MRLILTALLGGLVLAIPARAQEAYKIERLNEPAPATVAGAVTAALEKTGYKILDSAGSPFIKLWLRKDVPASTRPAGPKGAIQFPFLAEGELLGVLEFSAEGRDNRDQPITKGAYIVRYGLQPVNGDHLGVSPFRDYALLLPASKDKDLKPLPRKALEAESAEAAGSSHPAVFLLQAPAASAAESAPKMVQDAEKSVWSALVPLNARAKGEPSAVVVPVEIVVMGLIGG